MPIDKLTPRQLDADSDSKLVKKTAMLDALNLYSGDSEGGGRGVLKNIKGNKALNVGVDNTSLDEALGASPRVVGKAVDRKTGIIYLFVYSTEPSKHGVWAYDPEGKLEGDGVERVRLIYRSKQFNFPSQGFVKGDVVHVNNRTFTDKGEEFEKDAVIYFTDGVNEPRKINAYRAFSSENRFQLHETDLFSEADFITACPKTPVYPITFDFDRDESRSISNFKSESGFQFAYQNVYLDGFESAISCYSDVAFPPTIINQGAGEVDHSLFNRCNLTIPAQSHEIEKVKILGRKGNAPNHFIIDEIDVVPNEPTLYAFYNDRVIKAVSHAETDKQFDNLPRKAKAQSVTSNRLAYGNYLDGYDNHPTQCTATISYADRPDDFTDLSVSVKPSILYNGDHNTDTSLDGDGLSAQKSVGFELDFTEVPDAYSAGDTINFSITISPDKNWHVYQKRGGLSAGSSSGSYHQSRFIGSVDQTAPDNIFSDLNEYYEDFSTSSDEAGAEYLEERNEPVFGGSGGVEGNVPYWKVVDGEHIDSAYIARYGTSAGNPLVVRGVPVTFEAGFSFDQDYPSGGRIVVANTISNIISARLIDIVENPQAPNPQGQNYISDEQVNTNLLTPNSLSLTRRKFRTDVSLDLNLVNGQLIRQSKINDPEGVTDSFASLIVAVKGPGGVNSVQGTPQTARVPIGYFIINKADVTFDLERASDQAVLLPSFRICLRDLKNVEAHTCLHSPPSADHDRTAWIVASKEALSNVDFTIAGFLEEHNLDTVYSEYGFTHAFDFGEMALLENPEDYAGNPAYNYLKQIGYLDFGIQSGGSPTDFYSPHSQDGNNNFQKMPFSLMDGEGGPGGGKRGGAIGVAHRLFDTARIYNQGTVSVNWDSSLPVNPDFQVQMNTVFYNGTIRFYAKRLSGGQIDSDTIMPLIIDSSNASLVFLTNHTSQDEDDPEDQNAALVVDFKRLHSFAEISTLLFFADQAQLQDQSFKTSANHDFGIIYYDERGRHGFVNPLTTVYVPGYSSLERDGSPGSVSIDLSLEHDPPSWAHNYKIAYSKNTTAKDFIQYSAGGAFVQEILDQSISSGNQNIYVSLNYLQDHPISYSNAFGARGIDGGLSLYKFQEGDKLRVISYDNEGDREYPYNYDFNVVGVATLGPEENPLSTEPEANQQGLFLIIKNNPFAYGFDYSSTAALSSNWPKNCIIEIYSPLKKADEEERLYYEMGETGKIVTLPEGGLEHSPVSMTLTKGDVWFRKVPVNLRELEGGGYEDLIYADDGESSDPVPNFKSVYLETLTANDLIQSNSYSIGRPNVVSESSGEVIRESSITYSGATDPSSKKPKFSSFNLGAINFRDLSESYGGISYMADFGEYLIVLQEEKVSMVPVHRNVISDASGSQSLITSKEVLGTPVFSPEDLGSDSPSSAVEVDGTLFFADKNSYKICKMNKSGGGVVTISDKDIASLIRDEIRAQKTSLTGDDSVALIGGYDPIKEEYLLTISTISKKALTEAAEFAVQPLSDDVVVPGGGGPTDTDEDVIVVTDFNEDGEITIDDFISQEGLNVVIPQEGDVIISDVDGSGETNISDFVAQLVANGGNPTDIISGLIQNNPNGPEAVLSTLSDIITTVIPSVADQNEFLDSMSTTTTAIASPSTSDLVDQLIAKITQAGNSPPYDSITYGELTSILNSVDANKVGGTGGEVAGKLQQFYADVNRDGVVNTSDLLAFLAAFGNSPSAPSDLNLTEAGDLND